MSAHQNFLVYKWRLMAKNITDNRLKKSSNSKEHTSLHHQCVKDGGTQQKCCVKVDLMSLSCVSLSRCRLADRTLPGVRLRCRAPLQSDRLRLSSLLFVSCFFVLVCFVCVWLGGWFPQLWAPWHPKGAGRLNCLIMNKNQHRIQGFWRCRKSVQKRSRGKRTRQQFRKS